MASKAQRLREVIRGGDLVYYIRKSCLEKVRQRRKFTKRYKFIDRRNGTDKLIIILAGFQPYYWAMLASNVNNANYDKSDVCICIPRGLGDNKELFDLAEKYNWSVVYIKYDKLALVQNMAIKLHPNAKTIYKLDEDIMLPADYFRNMDAACQKIYSDGKCDPGMIVPVININLATFTDYIDIVGWGGCTKMDYRN